VSWLFGSLFAQKKNSSPTHIGTELPRYHPDSNKFVSLSALIKCFNGHHALFSTCQCFQEQVLRCEIKQNIELNRVYSLRPNLSVRNILSFASSKYISYIKYTNPYNYVNVNLNLYQITLYK
jgi:hypothetical protein